MESPVIWTLTGDSFHKLYYIAETLFYLLFFLVCRDPPGCLVFGLSRSSGMLSFWLVEAAGELGLGMVEGFWGPGLAVPAVRTFDGRLEVGQDIWAKVADCIYVEDFDVLLVVDVFV